MTDTITVTSGSYHGLAGAPSPLSCRTLHLTRVTPTHTAQASITVGDDNRIHAASWAARSLPQATDALLTLVEHVAGIYGKLTVAPSGDPDSVLSSLSQDETYAPYVNQNTPQKENQ